MFCEIAAGRAPDARICEDALTLALMDIAPAAHGPVLVITRAHFETLDELSAQAAQGVALTARRVALVLRDALQPEGLSVIQSNGAAANLTIPHYHVHRIPRRRAEAFHMHGKAVRDAKALETLAAAIAQRLPAA